MAGWRPGHSSRKCWTCTRPICDRRGQQWTRRWCSRRRNPRRRRRRCSHQRRFRHRRRCNHLREHLHRREHHQRRFRHRRRCNHLREHLHRRCSHRHPAERFRHLGAASAQPRICRVSTCAGRNSRASVSSARPRRLACEYRQGPATSVSTVRRHRTMRQGEAPSVALGLLSVPIRSPEPDARGSESGPVQPPPMQPPPPGGTVQPPTSR
jgi:hypothetical protein